MSNKRKFNENFNKIQNKIQFAKPTYLFSGGDSILWSTARNSIIDKFKSEGVWIDFVHHPRDIQPELDVIEFTFTEQLEEHNDFVDERVDRYNSEILHHHNLIITHLTTYNPPLVDLANRVLEENLDYMRKQGQEVKKREEYEREYVARQSAHRSHKHIYDKNVASCFKVFNETFHPSVLQGVRTKLDNLQFKSAWIALNDKYSTNSGGISSQIQLTNMLSATVYMGGDINYHLAKINNLCNELSLTGGLIDERMKSQYLINSIRNSSNHDFDSVLEFHTMSHSDYDTIVDALLVKNSQLLLDKVVTHLNRPKENYINKINNITSSQSPCSICGKKGHIASSCFKNKTCRYCGLKGHPTDRCFSNPESPQYKPGYKPRSNSNEGVLLTESNKGQQVSVANSFVKRHPKPKKKNEILRV